MAPNRDLIYMVPDHTEIVENKAADELCNANSLSRELYIETVSGMHDEIGG